MRAWQRAGLLLLGTGAVLLVLSWGGLLVLVGDLVVRGWTGAALLLAAAGGCLLVAAVGGATRDAGDAERSRSGLVAVLLLGLVAVALLGTVAGGRLVEGGRDLVLEPTSPDGCGVVVHETAFLFSGTAQVFVTGPLGVGHRVGEFATVDGERPFSTHSYALRWTGRDGFLEVEHLPSGPERSDPSSFTC